MSINKEVIKAVPFRGLVNIGIRLEMLFLGLIIFIGLSTALINNNLSQTIRVNNNIADLSQKIIDNSDRNYHATVNATKLLLDRGNVRNNQTTALFFDLINKINNSTNEVNNQTHMIANASKHLEQATQRQVNQSATSVQAERNFHLLQQIMSILNNQSKTR